MLNHAFTKHLEDILSEKVETVKPVSGGDISKAYRIATSYSNYFLKLNGADKFNMFKTEAYGLELIAKTNTVKTPRVLAFDVFENSAFLLMDFIDSKSALPKDFITLGEQLGALHQNTSKCFGLDKNNYIGSLNQSNNKHLNWDDFFIEERLLPQLILANSKGLLNSKETPSINTMKGALKPLFENIQPSLLHGDLWSGNYLIGLDGTPYLIDLAIYYGHNEVDIAMTKLFGGFSNDFYKAYYNILPPDTPTNQRIDIYQLYYLLVHLNLFGRSYYGSVISVLKKHF
ncbi:fructosamine kinase family protein [Seonamhaeicola aphaedonensis]|uniref:Fructosamine-3-kinase n=1 Tax=Seonamhaeicola aphaedonensis TaxID=1461338 RepID=A0A3D9H960_9FLAO|nr:fructosamine kinase family protein [Seonamhaeicola aphaedonensis]RED46025.1 fructosamine-3-kinase [Seonamhaeicola aphaedonensis]